MDRPNIVLIMTDEMRGDCMGAAGHPDVKTPYLDSLLSGGVYFPNAYSACPSCVPARAALHTGLSQRTNGRVGYQDRVPWRFAHTMAGELTACGYQTQEVGKMHVHPLRNSMGFQNIELHDGYLHAYRGDAVPYGENQLIADDYFYWLKQQKGVSCDVTDTGLDCNSWIARPWIYEERFHPTNWVTDRSIDFLRRRDPDKPFFLMTSYVRPHAPYDAPQAYFDMYRDRPLRPPFQGDWDDREALAECGRTFNSSTGPLDEALIREQQIGYYASISHVDHQIGRLLIALTERHLGENTVILFTSDHGEMLSDHALCRKSRPYQGSIHIPMFLYGPSAYIGDRRVSDALVELRDVMPTLLDIAGAPIPETVEGVSMLRDAIQLRHYLHGEHSAGRYSNQFIVTKVDKYVWYSQTGEEQYFRIDTDPNETKNEISEPKWRQRIGELRNALIRELTGREEGYTDGIGLITGRPPLSCLTHVKSSVS